MWIRGTADLTHNEQKKRLEKDYHKLHKKKSNYIKHYTMWCSFFWQAPKTLENSNQFYCSEDLQSLPSLIERAPNNWFKTFYYSSKHSLLFYDVCLIVCYFFIFDFFFMWKPPIKTTAKYTSFIVAVFS